MPVRCQTPRVLRICGLASLGRARDGDAESRDGRGVQVPRRVRSEAPRPTNSTRSSRRNPRKTTCGCLTALYPRLIPSTACSQVPALQWRVDEEADCFHAPITRLERPLEQLRDLTRGSYRRQLVAPRRATNTRDGRLPRSPRQRRYAQQSWPRLSGWFDALRMRPIDLQLSASAGAARLVPRAERSCGTSADRRPDRIVGASAGRCSPGIGARIR